MKFYVMDRTGHSTVEFKPEETEAAMAKFMELVGEQKFTAATKKSGKSEYNVIKDPKDIEDETLFVPHLQGG